MAFRPTSETLANITLADEPFKSGPVSLFSIRNDQNMVTLVLVCLKLVNVFEDGKYSFAIDDVRYLDDFNKACKDAIMARSDIKDDEWVDLIRSYNGRRYFSLKTSKNASIRDPLVKGSNYKLVVLLSSVWQKKKAAGIMARITAAKKVEKEVEYLFLDD